MPRILIAAALAFLTTTAAAQEVSYDFDKSADFSTLHNYTWVRGTPVNDELNHKRIVAAIDEQLGAKGLHQVERRDGADVLIAYHAVFARDLQIHGMSSGWGGYRVGPSRSGTARVEQVVVGTLVVEVIDARTGSTIWRGIASREVDVNASPEKREKNIDKAAQKLFKHYPPTT
jgi:Domain of unknown function (DUF4136)